MIQEKLNSYLAFVETGEILESYPAAEGRSIKLVVICQFEPDEEGARFLSLRREVIKNAGLDFGYRVENI
ncbi:DUF6572 domain-containing protein [Zoogloea sp.]|uniref:DUF6572 domain-containing protein n=1 Tax=Zoogloea sp. TaxID=49181 RepID=UPI00345BE105